MILFADTSSDDTKIALIDMKTKSFADEMIFPGKGVQSEVLLRKIDDLLVSNEITKKSLEAIIAVTGPGSYTGLRIGLSTFNTMAFALDIPIIGIAQGKNPIDYIKDELLDNHGFFLLPDYLYPPKITKPH